MEKARLNIQEALVAILVFGVIPVVVVVVRAVPTARAQTVLRTESEIPVILVVQVERVVMAVVAQVARAEPVSVARAVRVARERNLAVPKVPGGGGEARGGRSVRPGLAG